jgi:hypothetical protein
MKPAFCTLQRHLFSSENSIHIFPEIKLRGLVPNSYILVSVSDLYLPATGPPILLGHRYMNGHRNCE